MIGYKGFSAGDYNWRSLNHAVVPLSPPHRISSLNVNVASNVLDQRQELFIRWETEFDSLSESEWWHVIKSDKEDISLLPKKTRYMIRKAEKEFYVKKVTRKDIIDHGYSVYELSFQRYDTFEQKLSYDCFVKEIYSSPETTEYFAVLSSDDDLMVGFSENYIEDKVCFFVSMWLVPEHMKKFSGYLLFHEMHKYYLNDSEFKYVSDGARSISHDTNIHSFLISKFNYRKAYSKLNVVYRPWFSILVKFLFVFKGGVYLIPLSPFKKLSVLLKQEAIRRSFNNGS